MNEREEHSLPRRRDTFAQFFNLRQNRVIADHSQNNSNSQIDILEELDDQLPKGFSENVLTALPLEVLTNILNFLSPESIENLRCVDRYTRLVVSSISNSLGLRTLKELSQEPDLFDEYITQHPDFATYQGRYDLFLLLLRKHNLDVKFSNCFTKSKSQIGDNKNMIRQLREKNCIAYRGGLKHSIFILPLDLIEQINSYPLTFINIEYTSIFYFPNKVLETQINLTALTLWQCSLIEIPKSLTSLKNLRYLNLDYNKITVLPNIFEELPKLETVFLSYNLIKTFPDIKPQHFARSPYKDVRFYGNCWDNDSKRIIEEIEAIMERKAKRKKFLHNISHPIEWALKGLLWYPS